MIDTSHPLCGQNVADTIFCLPSGRGSCTASQVLLELILRDKAPRAIVMRDDDVMVCVGALIAQEVFFKTKVPDIISIGSEQFHQLLHQSPKYGRIERDGSFVFGNVRHVHHHDHQHHDHHHEHIHHHDHNDGVDDDLYHHTTNTAEDADPLDSLTLTEEEQQMLASCAQRGNEAQYMATRVLIRYAHLTNPTNPTYRSVTKAHIDGCTYIGPCGLDFVKRLVGLGGAVAVPTTLNAVSADRQQWSALGVSKAYARASMELGDAYLALGCQPSFTCAPYLLPHATPQQGEDVVWGESNAVVFANSVLGARTEKYADYLDICCAIVGKVAATGVHLEEHRQPQVVLDATELAAQLYQAHQQDPTLVDLELLFPALGHLCGDASDGHVPLLIGLESLSSFITRDYLRAFCAAFGTTGTSPLVHIAGITPEAKEPQVVENMRRGCKGSQPVVLTLNMLQETFHTLDSGRRHDDGSSEGEAEKVDLIALGNPHLSVSECQRLAELIARTNGQKDPSVRIMACMSRMLHVQAQQQGYIEPLTKFGVEFVHDTCWCMLLDPPVIPVHRSAKILTNSGKYAHYGPGLTQRQFRFGSMEDCVRAAVSGVYTRKETPLTIATSTGTLSTPSATNAAVPSWLTRPGQLQQRTYVDWRHMGSAATMKRSNQASITTTRATSSVARVAFFFVKKLR